MARTILLADDSITIQKIVNLTFSGEGIDVVSVSNGDAAVKKIHEIRPDLVLADIFMPGKNGYEVCEYIKKDPNLMVTPVILLVGAFEPFDNAEATRVRADGHLTKPFEIKVLISAVNSLISASQAEETPRDEVPEVEEVAEEEIVFVPEALSSLVTSEPEVHEDREFIDEPEFELPATSNAAVSVPLPEMPQPQVGASLIEGVDATSVPEPVLAEPPIFSMPLSTTAEELEIVTGQRPEMVIDMGNVIQEQSQSSEDELPPLISDDFDPLGLYAVEPIIETKVVEAPMDSRSMVVDIWEPPASTEPEGKARIEKVIEQEVSSTEEVRVELEAIPAAMVAPQQVEKEVAREVARESSAEKISPPVAPPTQVSEEFIDLIVSKVVEKLSRETIEKIAWEVVPDLAELMIKEHIEVHLKEAGQR